MLSPECQLANHNACGGKLSAYQISLHDVKGDYPCVCDCHYKTTARKKWKKLKLPKPKAPPKPKRIPGITTDVLRDMTKCANCGREQGLKKVEGDACDEECGAKVIMFYKKLAWGK